MIIDKDITKFIILSEDSIIRGLEKIRANKRRIIFAVNEVGILEGVMTDGDFRTWLMDQDSIDLHRSVSAAMNKNFISCRADDPVEHIEALFSDRVEYIPLLDRFRRLVGVASRSTRKISIGRFEISQDSPCFVIAEIGNNHNGSVDQARKLVDEAIRAGADCAKFQMRSMAAVYRDTGNDCAGEDLGTEYTLDLLKRFQLSDDDMFSVFDYCREKGVLPLCTPWDMESLEKLDRYDMQAYKVASADLTNHDLLKAIASKGKPLLCSTGMSTEQEIAAALDLLNRLGAQFVVLHCNSTYPAPFKDINLTFLEHLKEIGNSLVGYSGHERGISVPIAAVTLGAKVVEKHFTLDKTMEGNDHKVSLLPEEFRSMVEGIREVEQALGMQGPRRISQGELINRENLAKSLVASRDLKRGEIVTEAMVEVRSPGKGLPPYRKRNLLGKAAKRDIRKGDFFYPSDMEENHVAPRPYSFNRAWGVPVRFHDALRILPKTNMDLLEFHLSYKDLEEDIEARLPGPLDVGFVVHSPELFRGDHILDFCSNDEAYRRQSLAEFQRVIDMTRELKRKFPKTERPGIVVNIGGFTNHAHLEPAKRAPLYDLFSEGIAELDVTGVEVLPQTMPPFPWHFGGQRYHNLFVDPEEVVSFCRTHGLRVCLDVSHAKLACNHYHWSFKEYLEKVGPYTTHIHIADAEGVDGEGLQIGQGNIDFRVLFEELDIYAPHASFIPEIWQGHKNDGEGFWIALDRLDGWGGAHGTGPSGNCRGHLEKDE